MAGTKRARIGIVTIRNALPDAPPGRRVRVATELKGSAHTPAAVAAMDRISGVTRAQADSRNLQCGVEHTQALTVRMDSGIPSSARARNSPEIS
jgi:hypothetical protein